MALQALPTSPVPDIPAPRTESTRPAAATPSPAASVASTPVYFKSGELDKSPVPLAEVTPEYPDAAGSKRGHVVLELFIDETGEVERVDVLSATPPGVFDESARSASQKARFEPGRRLGLPSKSRITVEVDYVPADRDGQVSSRGY